jgi:hypothetical protein
LSHGYGDRARRTKRWKFELEDDGSNGLGALPAPTIGADQQLFLREVDIGETCDNAAATDAFACIPGPNIGTLGGPCDNVNVFCGPTTVCSMVTLSCVHFCCDKSDCTSGECTPVYTVGSASVGACLGEIPTNDAAGAGGAGDGAAGNGGAAG